MTWIYPSNITPTDYHSFVYRISFPDGTYYLGKKKLWVEKAKKISKESDWKDYWGSSQLVKDKVALVGEANVTREIIKFCVSAGEASWEETVALIKGDCMVDPLCLNGNVLMSFHKKVVTGYNTQDRRDKYLKTIKKQKENAGL